MSEREPKIVPAGLGKRVEATEEEKADGQRAVPGVEAEAIQNNDGRRQIFIPIRRD